MLSPQAKATGARAREVAFAHAGLMGTLRSRPRFAAGRSDHLIGDSSKARTQLGWSPTIDFPGLVKMMVDADMERLSAKQKT